MMVSLKIQLLGSFQARTESDTLLAIHRPQLQQLAAYLLLHANQPVLRSQLAFLFWPDSREKQARTNLRKLLHTLRNLDTHIAAALDLSSETVCWRLAPTSHLDLATFAEHLRDAAQATDSATRLQHLTSALEAYGGEFLPGHYEEWVLVAREELRLRYVNALEERVALHQALGDLRAALQAAQRLVQADPVQERAYRLVMGLYLELGEPAAALRTYHACTRLLGEELDVEPSPETQAFHARILRAEAHTTPHTTLHTAPHTTAAAPANHQPQHYPSERATRAAFVGRRSEWHTLRRLWQTIARSGPQLVVIRGEAGIGKTRLAEELADTARKQGHVTLYARAYAAEGRTAYGPVADLLRDAVLNETFTTLEPKWRQEIARILPEVSDGETSPAPLVEAWQQRRFHEALARSCLAQGSPLLIHLDDLQWFDAETLSWLHFLLRYDTTTPLLVVGTLRSGEIGPDHPYDPLRHALRQADVLHEIELSPLSAAEVAAMGRAFAPQSLEDDALAALYAATEGNPLFVLETLRAAGENVSQAKPQWHSLTPKIQAVIHERLAQLSPPARRAIELAAAIGRHCTYDLLHAIIQRSAPAATPVPELELVAALDELWQRRIIREYDVNAYDFSHDRIREVVYSEISPILRPHLHAQIASTLEHLHAADPGPVSSQLGAHWIAAGQPSRAVPYYDKAAHYAAQRFAHDEALEHLQRALTLLPDQDIAARFALRLRCEEVHALQSGASEARRANLDELSQLADALHNAALEDATLDADAGRHRPDAPDTPDAPDAAEARTAMARQATVAIHFSNYYTVVGEFVRAAETARQAIRLAELARAPLEKARGLGRLGYAAWSMDDMGTAHSALTEAVELAQSIDAEHLEAECLEKLAALGTFTGMEARTIGGYLERAYDIYIRRNDVAYQSSVLKKLGYLSLAQGEDDIQVAVDYYERALALCKQQGVIIYEAWTLGNLGLAYMTRGDYCRAECYMQEGLSLARRLGERFRTAIDLGFLAELRMSQGQLDAAVELSHASLELFDELGSDHRGNESLSRLGFIHYLRQDYAAAATDLQTVVNRVQTRGDRRFEATAWVRLGHVYLAQDRLDDARTAFGKSYELRQSLQQYRRSLEPLAGLAQVAWRENRHDDALDLATQIYIELQETTLEFTEEALQVYVTCHQIFCANADPRADDVYNWACDHLARRAATVTEDERPAFDALPLHRALRDSPQLPTSDSVSIADSVPDPVSAHNS